MRQLLSCNVTPTLNKHINLVTINIYQKQGFRYTVPKNITQPQILDFPAGGKIQIKILHYCDDNNSWTEKSIDFMIRVEIKLPLYAQHL